MIISRTRSTKEWSKSDPCCLSSSSRICSSSADCNFIFYYIDSVSRRHIGFRYCETSCLVSNVISMVTHQQSIVYVRFVHYTTWSVLPDLLLQLTRGRRLKQMLWSHGNTNSCIFDKISPMSCWKNMCIHFNIFLPFSRFRQKTAGHFWPTPWGFDGRTYFAIF